MKKLSLVLVIGLSLVLMAGGAFAASDTKTLTINATVTATAKLSLDQASISFANADPDTTPSITASPDPVNVTAKAKTSKGSNVTLTVVTNDDLKSGTDIIPIGNVTWIASGSGFASGTMNKATPQSAGSWTDSGNRSGTFSYRLANSWDYPTGSYSATATYTLTAP